MDYQHHIWTPAHQFHSKWSKTTPHIIRRETTAQSSSISGPHRLSSVTLQPQLVGFSELWFPMNCLWPMTTLASSLVGSSLEVHFLQISPFTCVSATNKTQQLSLSRSLSHSTTLKLHTKNYKIKMFPSQQTWKCANATCLGFFRHIAVPYLYHAQIVS